MDQRYYPPERMGKDVYFDKILKDLWEPSAKEYERITKEKRKKKASGGKAWRPKSAPKLTTTIPPERGPTPQGLTYLTGDDIVQNIG